MSSVVGREGTIILNGQGKKATPLTYLHTSRCDRKAEIRIVGGGGNFTVGILPEKSTQAFLGCQLCRPKVTTRWPETAGCGLLLYVRSYTGTKSYTKWVALTHHQVPDTVAVHSFVFHTILGIKLKLAYV
jgi:hypothetical protein